MVGFEKIVKSADAVLNCIPIVSTVSNAAQAMYKSANRVDTLNPVAPGLKTSIKIHVLSKNNSDYFFAAIPILGNLRALGELIGFILNGFTDDLMRAVCLNNAEVVHLCLGNNPLNDPDRADRILRQAAFCSSNEVFRKVLNHRDDWSAKNLVNALKGPRFGNSDARALNANDILDFWTAHGRVLGADDLSSAAATIEYRLQIGKVALAERVIGILPREVPFYDINTILLEYSCPQYNGQGEPKETGVLNRSTQECACCEKHKALFKRTSRLLRGSWV